MEFVPASDYRRGENSGAVTWNKALGFIDSSYIQVKKGTNAQRDTDNRRAVILLAHEIIHALGVYGYDHVSPRFDTIMEGTGHIYDLNQGIQQPRSLLYPVDREALRALYGRLAPGDDPTDLGPWGATSTHLVGNGAHSHFGVALRNGYAEPWAYGHLPSRDLATNRALSGSVTWAGTTLGLTPDAKAVVGNANIGVDLDSLEGRADFTSLEQWASGIAPGDTGTGTTWEDGDLGYSIAVRGNMFKQTGGDEGLLTGIFTGKNHQGAACTLVRPDLTAAFGATR